MLYATNIKEAETYIECHLDLHFLNIKVRFNQLWVFFSFYA